MTKIPKNINDSFLNENKYIFKKYKPIKKIGKGTFGNIYSTIRLKDKSVFAMKTEKKNAIEKILESEAYFLYTLQGFGIPKLISYGQTKKYNILIETLLGNSLHDIFLKKRRLCNIIDLCLIGIQLIDRLEWIHSKNIVYRDVKPENFLLGIDDPNVLYIVDFGLCKKYRSSKTGKHLLPKLTGRFSGTLSYASVNAIKGKELSRRDDLISLGYVLIKIFKKTLPWISNFFQLTKKTYLELIYLKEKDAYGKLFQNIPDELINFVKYTKNLKFEQEPNYSYLRALFIKILNKRKLNYKALCFTFIEQNNKKLFTISRNNSMRRTSPQYRILQNIKKEIEERMKSEKDIKNLKIKSNNISISNIPNIPTLTINTDKNEKNTSMDKRILSHRLGLSNLNSLLNSQKKDKNYSNEKQKFKYIKKIIHKKKFSLINENKNKSYIIKKNYINKNFFSVNKESRNKNIYKKLLINKKINPILKINKSNTNLNCNSKNPTFYKQKILIKNLLPIHKKLREELNLYNMSDNIQYKSPLLKNNNITPNNYRNPNFNSYKNIYANKVNLFKNNNSYNIPDDNIYKKYEINNIKTFQNNDNLNKDLNIILINNSIKFIKNGNNISLNTNYNI